MTAFSLIEPCIGKDLVLSLQSWVNPFYWWGYRLSAFLIKQGPFSSSSGSELKAGGERNDKWKAFQQKTLHIHEVFSNTHPSVERLSHIVRAKRLSVPPFFASPPSLPCSAVIFVAAASKPVDLAQLFCSAFADQHVRLNLRRVDWRLVFEHLLEPSCLA